MIIYKECPLCPTDSYIVDFGNIFRQTQAYCMTELEDSLLGTFETLVKQAASTGLAEQSEYAIVIFDSEYGNTEKVAHALARGLHDKGFAVDCVSVKDVSMDRLNQYGLIALGAPTQAFSASGRMKEFLAKLEGVDLHHKSGFAFDTKLKNRLAGSAGAYVEKRLRKLGVRIIEPHFSAIVKGKEGPLEEGAEEKFEKMGVEIAGLGRG